ncbi:MAG: 2-oxo acid dehydrogenase subunit E2 [Pirellulaceae bacterium]|nr:2-oxo acid dehydrogenase subunit E2 [Pirellulaceae bacterium]
MASEIKLPELGDGIESGDVLELYVSVGEVVEKGQDLLEIETDKATVAVPSDAAGKITAIHVAVGDSIPVGSPMVSIESGDTAEAAPEVVPEPPAEVANEPPPAPPVESPLPEPPASVAATPSPTVAPSATSTPLPTPTEEQPSELTDSDEPVPAGPAVRRFAREVGVDLTQVTGSGEGNRITRDDVLRAVRNQGRPAAPNINSSTTPSLGTNRALPPRPSTGENDKHGPIRIEKMARIRKVIGAKMGESWSTVPRVTNFDDADVTELEKIRQASKNDYASAGIKLTSMPFLIKAVAQSLRQNPEINGAVDLEAGKIVYKEYVNVGIAVDTERGLVVPSLREADRKSISEIARDLTTIATNARNNTFGVEDLQGSTFTISNLGAIGGTYSTPMVNVPEVAILLVGRSRKLPVVMEDDSITPRLMLPMSLSYDHRLVDGATAARYLNDIKGFLEAPSRLLLAL